MALRVFLIAAVALALAACTTTSGDSFKDRSYSTQGKVKNDYDYLI